MIQFLIATAAVLLLSNPRSKNKGKRALIYDGISKSSKKNEQLNDQEIGTPWERCDPPYESPKGTEAVFGKDGKCMVFWQPNTINVVRQSIQQELLKLSKKDRDFLCSASHCEPDPFAIDPLEFCSWSPNPG